LSILDNIYNEIRSLNSLGVSNLAEKNVTISEDSTTREVMQNISNIAVQANYSQNDPTKSDYIKDRPCYISGTETVSAYDKSGLPNCNIGADTPIFTEIKPDQIKEVSLSIKSSTVSSYTSFLNVPIKTTSLDSTLLYYIGNIYYLTENDSDNTHEKYAVYFASQGSQNFFGISFDPTDYPDHTNDSTGITYSVKLDVINETVHSLDKKYLPTDISFLNKDDNANSSSYGSKAKGEPTDYSISAGPYSYSSYGSSFGSGSMSAYGGTSLSSGLTGGNSSEFTTTRVSDTSLTFSVPCSYLNQIRRLAFIIFCDSLGNSLSNYDSSKVVPVSFSQADVGGYSLGYLATLVRTGVFSFSISFSPMVEGMSPIVLPSIPGSGKCTFLFSGSVGGFSLGPSYSLGGISIGAGASVNGGLSLGDLNSFAENEGISIGSGMALENCAVALGKEGIAYQRGSFSSGGYAIGDGSVALGDKGKRTTVSDSVTLSKTGNKGRYLITMSGNHVLDFESGFLFNLSESYTGEGSYVGYIEHYLTRDPNQGDTPPAPSYDAGTNKTMVVLKNIIDSSNPYLDYVADSLAPCYLSVLHGADATNSCTIGTMLSATSSGQLVIGTNNSPDSSAAFIIGSGSESSIEYPGNSFVIGQDGSITKCKDVHASSIVLNSTTSDHSTSLFSSSLFFSKLSCF
jgi:hypothetical protein